MSVVLFAIIISVFSYFLWYYISNKRTWDLLSKIPAPKSIPLLKHGAHFMNSKPEDILKTLWKFYDELGSFFYFTIPGNTKIVISDAKIAEQILTSQRLIEKSSEYDLISAWLGTGLLISNGKKWFQRRKIITPAFHFKILEQFVDSFHKHGDVFVEKLKSFQGKEIDVFPLISLYALDVICGNKFNFLISIQINSRFQSRQWDMN